MPAWITSELRLEVWLPISRSASTISVLRSLRARRAAQARPRAPAPMIRVSTLSIVVSDAFQWQLAARGHCLAFQMIERRRQVQRLAGFGSQPAGFVEQAAGNAAATGDLAYADMRQTPAVGELLQ